MHPTTPTHSQTRSGAALEALGEKRDALADFKRVLTLAPRQEDAIAGVKRLEAALGLPSSLVSRGGGAAGSSGGRERVTEEDARMLDEVKARVKDVALQKKRAKDQQVAAQRDKRSLELTLGQVGTLAPTVRTFRPVGRMFMLAPRDDLHKSLTEKLARAETKLKVCATALEHIEKQEKEADAAFLEAADNIRRKMARSA